MRSRVPGFCVLSHSLAALRFLQQDQHFCEDDHLDVLVVLFLPLRFLLAFAQLWHVVQPFLRRPAERVYDDPQLHHDGYFDHLARPVSNR